MAMAEILALVSAVLLLGVLIAVIVIAVKFGDMMKEMIKLMKDQAERADELAAMQAEAQAQQATEPEGEIVTAQGFDSEEVVVIPRVVVEQVQIEEEPTAVEPAPVEEPVTEQPAPVEQPVPVEEPAEEVVEQPVEEVVVVEEPVAEVAEEVVVVEEPTQEETAATEVVGEVEDPFGDIKKIPFATKLLGADEQTQIFYDTLNNEFNSYRKLHIRISAKCVSYRLGRELVAKITYRGKTMKLHLALDVTKYPENIYFQKDESDVKAYEEVPFTVKVKSERGLKRAIALIEALAAEKAIEKKTHWTAIDSIADLKEWSK